MTFSITCLPKGGSVYKKGKLQGCFHPEPGKNGRIIQGRHIKLTFLIFQIFRFAICNIWIVNAWCSSDIFWLAVNILLLFCEYLPPRAGWVPHRSIIQCHQPFILSSRVVLNSSKFYIRRTAGRTATLSKNECNICYIDWLSFWKTWENQRKHKKTIVNNAVLIFWLRSIVEFHVDSGLRGRPGKLVCCSIRASWWMAGQHFGTIRRIPIPWDVLQTNPSIYQKVIIKKQNQLDPTSSNIIKYPAPIVCLHPLRHYQKSSNKIQQNPSKSHKRLRNNLCGPSFLHRHGFCSPMSILQA